MFFKKKDLEIVELSESLYKLIIRQSRSIGFYKNLGVPDTIDGRFELIILHFYLIERVLNKKKNKDLLIFQELLDIMYKDFDMSLREMGVGDLSVGKKIYHMTEAFSGRLMAYRSFDNNESLIKKTLRKNLYGTIRKIDKNYLNKMKDYIIDSMKIIDRIEISKVEKNSAIFLDLNRYINN